MEPYHMTFYSAMKKNRNTDSANILCESPEHCLEWKSIQKDYILYIFPFNNIMETVKLQKCSQISSGSWGFKRQEGSAYDYKRIIKGDLSSK